MTMIHLDTHLSNHRGLSSTFKLWHRNAVTRATLRRLTADQLADIGLTPQQAKTEARKWFWQR